MGMSVGIEPTLIPSTKRVYSRLRRYGYTFVLDLHTAKIDGKTAHAHICLAVDNALHAHFYGCDTRGAGIQNVVILQRSGRRMTNTLRATWPVGIDIHITGVQCGKRSGGETTAHPRTCHLNWPINDLASVSCIFSNCYIVRSVRDLLPLVGAFLGFEVAGQILSKSKPTIGSECRVRPSDRWRNHGSLRCHILPGACGEWTAKR